MSTQAIDLPHHHPPARPPTAAPHRRDAYRRATRAVSSDRLTANRLLAAVLLCTLGIYVCWDAWDEIFSYAWGNEEYAHIFVVPFVAALLIYQRRLRFRHFRISGTLVGPLLAVAGLAVMLAGYDARRQAMFHSGAVLTAIGCVVSVLGKNAIFRFLPAVLVLAFLVPVPGGWRLNIALALQQWTTQIAHVLLATMGFANEVAGNTISLNGRPVQIAEACNGMRSVFTLLLLAFAFAFGLPLRNSVRVGLLVVSPLVALTCNVVRTIPTILMYAYAPGWFDDPAKGTWYAEQFHNGAGWAMYVVAILLWLSIVSLMRWAMLPIQRFTLASQ
jgi:exosortase